ncbi:MAG: HAMP domain-containing histidine kinase [Elusimicrobia bacterium]|nr:HAMP domain-containing histidine kinase [Elusimicrobiota bacterium]
MRLRTLIGLTIGGAVAFSFTAAWLAAAAGSARLISTRLGQEHERHLAAMAAIAEEALAAGDTRVLAEYLRTLPAAAPKVDYAFLEDSRGVIAAHSDPKQAGRPAAEWRLSRPAGTALSRPISKGVVRLGTRGAAHASAFAELRAVLAPSLLLIGGAGLFLSVVLGAALAVVLTAPISRLVDAAAEVGAGKLDARVPVDSSGELGQLAEQFNRMAERLGELDELKDAFIASVSHDLRSPMVAIKMSLDHMLNEDPDGDKLLPQHRKTLTDLTENAARLANFVSNILDAAKMKAGRMECRREPVDVARAVRDVATLYGALAQSQSIRFRTSVQGLPAVVGDPERLERVLSNLVSNAMKFTPAGGTIEVEADVVGEEIELRVRDSGFGMDERQLASLFQPFSQGDAARRKASGAGGTGLGLFIVKQSVEAMGGTVSVESAPDEGTCVRVRLPKAEAAGARRGA